MTGTLEGSWTWGQPLGGDPAGFGHVVEAFDQSGRRFAAKFVKKVPGASRELLLAKLGDDVQNVVPVVDSGEVGDSYVLVMPLAEKSLRMHMAQGGPIEQQDAVQILIDIASALASLDGRVVHRDLKPENVLLLDGSWCLADFGISRYADATTEVGETRKDFLSAAYAAPEQWLLERATCQTDVYAFGVVAYELLQGCQPFSGDFNELREQHLHAEAPAPKAVGAVLAALVQECMYKSPEARPRAANILAKLNRFRESASDDRWAALAAANHEAVKKQMAEDAATQREQSEMKRRQRLYLDSVASWQRLSGRFKEVVETHVPAARFNLRHDRHWYVELGEASFGLSFPEMRGRTTRVGFDVVATCALSVRVAKPARATPWIGRSHSLYFADAIAEDDFAWYETAFMDSPLLRGGMRDIDPYSDADVDSGPAAIALAPGVGTVQVAWPFTKIDTGDCDDFVQRWLDWFAAASSGRLQRPSMMPEIPVPQNWRRG